MKTISLQITYRKGRAFAAYVDLGRRPGEKSARSQEVTADVLVDYAEDGRAVGIEIITPGAVTIEEILDVFDELGLARPAESELAPLRAA